MSKKFASCSSLFIDLSRHQRSWNLKFDETIKSYGFQQSIDEAYFYKLIKDQSVVLLILYVDDFLLMGNNISLLSNVKN